MRAFFEELKAAVTELGRSLAFTALAAGVLGLGLGAVIFMYGVADTLMLKPPPYPDADRIFTISTFDGQKVGDWDEAMQEAQWSLWQQVLTAQQQAWLAAWRAVLGLRVPATSSAMQRAARDAAIATRRALQPVRRRVKANARRLKRRA